MSKHRGAEYGHHVLGHVMDEHCIGNPNAWPSSQTNKNEGADRQSG
jgi:hypothetical protein